MERKSRECLERLFDQWQSTPQICTVCRQDAVQVRPGRDEPVFSEESECTFTPEPHISEAPSFQAPTIKEMRSFRVFRLWPWLVEGLRQDKAAAVIVLSLLIFLVFLGCFVSACVLFA